MNKNATKWVEVLRSGKYKQAQSALRKNDGYCCLGVACDLYKHEVGGRWHGELFYPGDGDSGDGVLPTIVKDWLGLRTHKGSFRPHRHEIDALAYRNDKGASFAEIAELIESEPPELFR